MSKDLSSSGSGKNKIIHTIVILALFFLFRYIPPFGSVTEVGMAVLGIFLGCIYAWTVGEVFWPSVLGIVLIGFVGENTVTGVLSATFGDATLHMVFIALAFCFAVERSGLIELIAKYVLSRKFAKRGPWSMALGFWIATAVTCAVTCATTGIIILAWEMFYEVVRRAKLEKKTPYTAVVIIGILVSAYLGGIVMPYNAFTQICFGMLRAAAPGVEVGSVPYILLTVLLSVVVIAAMYFVSKYLLRIKVDYVIPDDLISKDELKVTRKHKIMAFFTLLFCVAFILPSFLPAELTITKLLSNLGFTGIFAVILVILSLIGDGEGGKMFDFGLCLKSGIPYGMVVLVAAALQVSSKLTDASTGIPDMLSTLLMPITTLSSPFVSMAIVMVIGLALTNVINNIVSITIMVPIGMTLLQNIEYSPQVMVTLFSLELIQGLITPSSSMAGAMLHGNDEWISSKSVYKYGLILEGVVALCIAVVGIPTGPAIFSLFS